VEDPCPCEEAPYLDDCDGRTHQEESVPGVACGHACDEGEASSQEGPYSCSSEEVVACSS
jgi:hypothetical protein